MSATFGPSTWWLKSKEAADYYARICPVGTILPDGSAVFCKTLGQAWIVAPNCTQITDQWASGRWNNCLIVGAGNCLPCICDWPNVCNRLVCCGFNPCDWFIPCQSIFVTAYNCRAFWDTCSSYCYVSATENSAGYPCGVNFNDGTPCISQGKAGAACVRSVRCITL
jgi:hypothetical protein